MTGRTSSSAATWYVLIIERAGSDPASVVQLDRSQYTDVADLTLPVAACIVGRISGGGFSWWPRR